MLKYIKESEQFKKQKGAKQQQQQSPASIKTFHLHDNAVLYNDCNFNPAGASAGIPPVVRFVFGTQYDK